MAVLHLLPCCEACPWWQARDRGMVDEHVLGAIIGNYETDTFILEPLLDFPSIATCKVVVI
jgi:hypothetical protein